MGLPKTRLDRVVQLRERAEDGALAGLARARAALLEAKARRADAAEETRADARRAGPVELWMADEHAHRRAVQALRAAETAVQEAERGASAARDGWLTARQETDAVRRARERRVTELLATASRFEQRAADEAATLRFNARETPPTSSAKVAPG